MSQGVKEFSNSVAAFFRLLDVVMHVLTLLKAVM
jgi:hypothetical protein